MYRRSVSAGFSVTVRRLAVAASGPVPGLRLKVHRGTVTINGQQLVEAALWSDTSPELVTIGCGVRTGELEFRAWNCWRDAGGVMQAWLENAGIGIVIQ